MEEELRARCDFVREVPHVHPRGAARLFRRIQVFSLLLRGRPVWVSWWAVDDYANCVRETAAAWRPDVVQLEYHLMGQYLPALRECPAPRVLVQYDPGTGSAPMPRFGVLGLRHLMGPLDQRAWRRYETSIMRGVDAVVVFTERDRATVTALAGDTTIVRIPLGAVVPEQALSPVGHDSSTLLFVGSFAHPPNVDAADRLIRAILPRVRVGRPDLRLVLVGGNFPADLRRRAGTGVEIAGSVPDVTPYLERASLVVMPLRQGGGMRVKALEALAAGKAIVASPLAVEGLDVMDGRECSIASTDAEFAERITHLLDHAEERRRLGTAARSWALDHLSWSGAVDAYDQLYRSLLEMQCRRP